MQLKKIRYSSILTVIAACVLSSCGQGEVQLPKPRLYPKIEYPTRGFDALDLADCPFVFNKPAYGNIVKDSYHDEGQPEHPCWFDILMPSINASIHCSYFEITDRAGFDKLVNDAFRLVTEHNVKADSRLETAVTNRHGVEGLYFDIEGNVATPIQFFLTDSTTHFFRASLYFDAKVDADSIAPVLAFVRTDIDSIISSFDWK